jgi:hypothetical protein
MYITLNEEYLDKTRKEAKKEAESNEMKDNLMYDGTGTDVITIEEVTDTEIHISVENKLGYFTIDVPITTDFLEDIVALSIKKMNKIKALLESVK